MTDETPIEVTPELKREVAKRLQREDRAADAEAFRETERRRLRKEGIARKDAVEQSWLAMIEAFPPIKDPSPPEAINAPLEAEPTITEDEVNDLLSRAEGQTATLGADIEWVYANLSAGDMKARDTAPSSGAYELWRYAKQHRTAFFEKLLPKVSQLRANEQSNATAELGERMELGGLSAEGLLAMIGDHTWDITCPCCNSVVTFDQHTKIVGHAEPNAEAVK